MKILNQILTLSSNDQGTVVVGESVNLEGKIDNSKDTNISGQYSGLISSDSLCISKSGELKGEVSAEHLSIEGEVEGEIKAGDLYIRSSAKVKGIIKYKNIDIQPGAIITAELIKTI